MNAKRILIGFMIILILAYFGFRGYQAYLAPVEPTPTPATIGPEVITVNAEGRVVPLSHLGLAFEIPGRVAEINISEGDRVEVEDPLLSLEKEGLQSQVDQARAAVKAARAQLEMLPKSASDDQEDQAEAQLEKALASLEAAQIQRDKADLHAPLGGTVTSLEVEEGQVVEAGLPVVILANTSRWQVETLDLLEEDAVKLQVGQPAEVKFAAYPNRTLEGRISKIAHNASSYQGNVTYQVTIDILDDEGLNLQWGMTAFVEIDPSAEVIPSPFTPTPTPEPTPTPSPTPTEQPPADEESETEEDDLPRIHTVRPGEFVYCLGRRFNIKPADILSENGLPPRASLVPGQEIVIPEEARPFPVERALSPHPTQYVVQPFDTLSSVACVFGNVYPEDIARENDLNVGDVLIPGQVLDIP